MMPERLTVSFNSWYLILQTVSDLFEAHRLLSPAAAIRETRLAPSQKAHNVKGCAITSDFRHTPVIVAEKELACLVAGIRPE